MAKTKLEKIKEEKKELMQLNQLLSRINEECDSVRDSEMILKAIERNKDCYNALCEMEEEAFDNTVAAVLNILQ